MNWMQPSAGEPALDRRDGNSLSPWCRAALVAATLAGLAGPAEAGDRALVDFIGFSPDSRYFAFEEFGIQDGSGFAYSHIYVVNLETDSWVVGSPVRVDADNEERTLASVRADALRKAGTFIADFGLDVPAVTAALNGDGIPLEDYSTLEFGAPGYGLGAPSGHYALSLEHFDTTATSPCEQWFDVTPQGYALTLDDGTHGRSVHRDEALPRSRGCPLDYRIYAVVMPFGSETLSHAVAIISVYPGGFEGPDRRFLAVPLGL